MLFATIIAVSAFGVYHTQAAGKIDESKQCTVTVQNPIAGYKGDIKVDFYKVADMDLTGQFKSSNVLTTEQLDSLKDATAETASALAEEAYNALKLGTDTPAEPTKTITFNMADSNSASGSLDRAMYLCVPEKAQDEANEYSFDYYLVSVPSSNYIQSTKVDENGNIVSESGDDWIYNVELILKSKATPRYGKLEIEKTLKTFNRSLGNASFVFSVEAEIAGETVFNNVYSIQFDSATTKSIVIDKIPATANVTVTEVYSGASYEISGENVQTTVIVADDTAKVSFVNDFDEHLQSGGISVVNEFTYDEEGNINWSKSYE